MIPAHVLLSFRGCLQQWRKFVSQRKLWKARNIQAQEHSCLRIKEEVGPLAADLLVCVFVLSSDVDMILSTLKVFRKWKCEHDTAVTRKQRELWAEQCYRKVVMRKCFFLWCCYVKMKRGEHTLAG